MLFRSTCSWLFSVDNPLRVATEALNIHIVSCILYYLREPFFNWNPPSRNTLAAICEDDVDDEYDMDKHVTLTQNDNDSFDEENSQADDDTGRPDGEVPRVVDDINSDDTNGHNMDRHVPHIHNDCDRFDEDESQAVNNNDGPAGVVLQAVVNNSYNDLDIIPQIMVAPWCCFTHQWIDSKAIH